MTKIEELLEQAKSLSAVERQELATRLRRSAGARRRPATAEGPYTALLELAGTAQSDARDVSRRKKKHLGTIYSRRPRG